MKQVKSKVTGDIGELDFDSREGVFIVVRYDLDTKETVKSYYISLEDLCEDWEDVPKEPKEYWVIDMYSRGAEIVTDKDDAVDKFNKEIGNYFETKEEAEKAVKKLKAWKRLKDIRFEFGKWRDEEKECYDGQEIGNISFRVDFIKSSDVKKDLDLLFSQEVKNE